MTFAMRKRCVIPHGTVETRRHWLELMCSFAARADGRPAGGCLWINKKKLTFSVLAEIQQLVTPLRDYTQRIFQEGDDDQETADRWEVSGKRSRKTPSVP